MCEIPGLPALHERLSLGLPTLDTSLHSAKSLGLTSSGYQEFSSNSLLTLHPCLPSDKPGLQEDQGNLEHCPLSPGRTLQCQA